MFPSRRLLGRGGLVVSGASGDFVEQYGGAATVFHGETVCRGEHVLPDQRNGRRKLEKVELAQKVGLEEVLGEQVTVVHFVAELLLADLSGLQLLHLLLLLLVRTSAS